MGPVFVFFGGKMISRRNNHILFLIENCKFMSAIVLKYFHCTYINHWNAFFLKHYILFIQNDSLLFWRNVNKVNKQLMKIFILKRIAYSKTLYIVYIWRRYKDKYLMEQLSDWSSWDINNLAGMFLIFIPEQLALFPCLVWWEHGLKA